MAVISLSPSYFLSLSSHDQLHSPVVFYQPYLHFTFHLHHRLLRQRSLVCFASARKSRKLMSDADLCDGLREFVAANGLPDGHVPSTKELLHHGRKDLANVVRRRGYKFIKELLQNSSESLTEVSDMEIDGKQNGSCVNKDDTTGQEENMKAMTEYPQVISSTSEVSSSGKDSATYVEPTISSDGQSLMPMESSATLFLQEKAAKFLKYGQLDTVEESLWNNLKVNGIEEGKGLTSIENLVETERTSHCEMDSAHLSSVSNDDLVMNGALITSTSENDSKRDNYSLDSGNADQGKAGADFDEDMSTEGSKMEELEINRLKFMLHQKEVELSRLKEQIEKEKETLSILQSKVENEISKAQNLISERDAELHAAEENLSGLEEVEIQYQIEGEMVEIAGSFNGWHQRIKMDPPTSSTVNDTAESRKSTLWSTTLWLYPGVYEIKFIVDGQWRIDPQREATIRAGIENNILRVGR